MRIGGEHDEAVETKGNAARRGHGGEEGEQSLIERVALVVDAFLFVHLKGRKEVIFERMSKRKDHYMPVSLLDSQFAILEESPDLLTVSLEQTPEEILAEILQQLEVR